MKYYVTSNDTSADMGTFFHPFIFGSGDIEIILETNINLTLTAPMTFFNSVSSVKIDTNGYACTLTGAGIIFKDINIVDVSNIAFINFIGDGIQLNNVSYFKVKKCSFFGHTSKTDEAISSVKGSGSIYGEISWCKFDGVYKGILCGTGDAGDETLDINQKIYIHHNYFTDFERRAPYCRNGKYSIYNNVFENWKFRDTQTFCIWAEDSATAIIASNSFLGGKYSWFNGMPKKIFSWFTKRPWDMNQGAIKRFGAKIYLKDNYKNGDWIILQGEVFDTPLDFPEYEIYSKEMETKVKSL